MARGWKFIHANQFQGDSVVDVFRGSVSPAEGKETRILPAPLTPARRLEPDASRTRFCDRVANKSTIPLALRPVPVPERLLPRFFFSRARAGIRWDHAAPLKYLSKYDFLIWKEFNIARLCGHEPRLIPRIRTVFLAISCRDYSRKETRLRKSLPRVEHPDFFYSSSTFQGVMYSFGSEG